MFLEKTKKKKGDQNRTSEEGGFDAEIQKQQHLRKSVDNLIKKQKRKQALKIVASHDDSKPWGADAKAKVVAVS